MLAGGSVGYGEAMHRGVQPEKLGAVIVGPILRHSSAGANKPRLAETLGGIVLHSGLQNRGVSAVLKKFAKGWSKLGCPVIAQVAELDPDMLLEVVERLMDAAMGMSQFHVELSGIELVVPRSMEEGQLRNLLRVVMGSIDLPLLIKLPLERAFSLAPIALEFDIGALVIASPMSGAGIANQPLSTSVTGPCNLVVGEIFGPLAFAPMMAVLHEVVALDLPCPIVAAGGIHSIWQARQALAAGAKAVQIDSALWVEPGLPAMIAEGLG